MDLLARREHSRLELERKLTARDYDSSEVAAVLDELEQDGLLSAERFARSFIESRYARGQGPYRIRRELAERGVPSADAWLEDEAFDWDALARTTRIRRFGEAPPANLREKARQIRFLEYRGFAHDQIRRALQSGDD
jgi:regulatory protein